MHVHNCIWEGSTNGQDMFGSGELYGCDISHNSFIGINDGQGIASNRALSCNFSDNYFYKCGNPIGLENVCEANTVNNNRLEGCDGYIKLSFNIPGELSRGNRVCNNTIYYGRGGIQDYAGRDDLIDGNFVWRTKFVGIEGAFDRCTISRNQLIETNYEDHTFVVGGITYRNGGINLLNNTNFTTNERNRIIGNTIRSGLGSFVIPAGYLDAGLTKTGNNGGIIVDTNNSLAEIFDNNVENTVSKIGNHGVNSRIRTNEGSLPAANADTSGATLVQLETEVNELKALLRSQRLLT
jgi:hypothetical protein